jgi:hypothetical protein
MAAKFASPRPKIPSEAFHQKTFDSLFASERNWRVSEGQSRLWEIQPLAIGSDGRKLGPIST